MKLRLTIRTVEAIETSAKDVIAWDSEVAGFGVKVTPKGRRTYFLYYRTYDGQQRRPAIGVHGSIKPEAAREIAKAWHASIAMGGDPSLSRSQIRSAPTVSQLCDRYLEEHAERKKKQSSVRNDRRLIETHLRPALGTKKISAISRADISTLHHKLRDTPYEANRLLALTSKMFKLGERWGLRPDGSNPATNIDRYPEHKRQRYLAHEEIARLWGVLSSEAGSKVASPSAIAAVKLLMLTGRRLNEILSLEWSSVDFDRGSLSLPDTKNGALVVALSEAALTVLRELKSSSGDNPYVIGGQKNERHMVNLQKPWRELRKVAQLEGVRLHDLRHTYASVGAGMGMSLPLLGRLLGHTQASTTSRYAHLAQDPVRIAAEAIGSELTRMSQAKS